MTDIKTCATDPKNGEYSLCGDAFDAPGASGCEEMEPFDFAKPGQIITCEECKRTIAAIYENYTKSGRVRRD